jgi:hypothetical protein
MLFGQHSDIRRLPLPSLHFSLASFTLLYCMIPVDISSNRTATLRGAPVSVNLSYPFPTSIAYSNHVYKHPKDLEYKSERASARAQASLGVSPFFPLIQCKPFSLSFSEPDSAERTHSASTRSFALTPGNHEIENRTRHNSPSS